MLSTDATLASASDAVILGFHAKIDTGVGEVAKREGVQIKLYAIIYELIEEVKAVQRRSREWFDLWECYCDECGGGTRDPRKHTTTFVRNFLDHVASIDNDGAYSFHGDKLCTVNDLTHPYLRIKQQPAILKSKCSQRLSTLNSVHRSVYDVKCSGVAQLLRLEV